MTPRSPQRCALAWQVKKRRVVRPDRAWACPSTSTIRRRRCWRACSARCLHASPAPPGDGDPFGYGWEQCSMLVELCACLHCDAFDLPHVLVAVSICDLSCFGHVSMVLYINILWYVRAPAPSMVPGSATWLLTSTTRR